MPTSYWLKFGNSMAGFNGSGVQFTHVEQPGSLTVSLVGTGTGFDATKDFNVTVTFDSAISYTIDGTPISTPSATCALTLHAGQSVTLGNIPYGTSYSVTEDALPSGDIADGYSTGSVINGSGTMTDAGSITATTNYIYTEPAYSDIIYLWNRNSSGTQTFYVKMSSSVVYKVDGVKQAAASEFTVGVPAGSTSKVAIEVRYGGSHNWLLQAATVGMPPVYSGTMYVGKGTTNTGVFYDAAAAVNLNNYQWDNGNKDFISNRFRQQA